MSLPNSELLKHSALLLSTARASIAESIKNNGHPIKAKQPDSQTDPLLLQLLGCFVTLHKNDQLRGCVGNVETNLPLINGVAHNAYNAAFCDPRFPPMEESELENLHISVSVLSEPVDMPVQSEHDLLKQMKPGIDGIILEDPVHRGLFLPEVWETLPDPKDFLEHLKMKSGILPGEWPPGMRAKRFVTTKMREK